MNAKHDVPADAGEVTVAVGFAPSHARALWSERAVKATELPSFAGDTPGIRTGGDLLVQVSAETSAAVRSTTAKILAATRILDGAEPVWEQGGYRDAPTENGTTRTNLGFIDGIVNPRSSDERMAGVWTGAERDTYVVLRRMTIASEFLRLSVGDQERAIGRRRDSGVPLSGGSTMDNIDLFAKSTDGQLRVPAAAHARRAHPANLRRPLMMRRSYSFETPDGAGTLFAAFMNDPETFVMTQRRLDEKDDLIRHTTTDASGCFFVPGDLGQR